MAMMERGEAESLIERFRLDALSLTPGDLQAVTEPIEPSTVAFDFAGLDEA